MLRARKRTQVVCSSWQSSRSCLRIFDALEESLVAVTQDYNTFVVVVVPATLNVAFSTMYLGSFTFAKSNVLLGELK